jgi:hypothetical protein
LLFSSGEVVVELLAPSAGRGQRWASYDAVLLQVERAGLRGSAEEAVVGGDGVGEGLLEVGAEAANVAANGFAHIDAGFEEDDGEFGLGLAVEEFADVAEEEGFFGAGT